MKTKIFRSRRDISGFTLENVHMNVHFVQNHFVLALTRTGMKKFAQRETIQ